MTIITKLATPRALTITTQVHNSQLANTNDSINLPDIFARCGRTTSPLLEKKLSTGAELAGKSM